MGIIYFDFFSDIYILFAITESTQDIYKDIAEKIGQPDNVALLSSIANNQTTEEDKLKDLIKQHLIKSRDLCNGMYKYRSLYTFTFDALFVLP